MSTEAGSRISVADLVTRLVTLKESMEELLLDLQDLQPYIPAQPAEPAIQPRRMGRKRFMSDPPQELSREDIFVLQQWASSAHPELQSQVVALVSICLDYFRGKGEKRADWVATCRTWIRNEARFAAQRKGLNGAPRRSSLADASAQVLATLRARGMETRDFDD